MRSLCLLLASAVLAAGCGPSAPTPDVGAIQTAAAQTAVAELAAATAAAPRGGPVTSLESAESAVVQIEAQGSFVHPEFGLVENVGGRGSGFIIDPQGTTVTNNHVVTGAAFLRVRVAGEEEQRNARILGVSECSDLAVIDIEGDGYPYFQWYDGEVRVGLDVYAAGFPLGTPDFTLNRGIVSKARVRFTSEDARNWTDVDALRGWTSVERVLEHDANIQPGNSGGPLITAEGRVVGVNYAGLPGPTGTEQFYAIAYTEAVPIIDQLRQERDVHSVGVNGFAIHPESGYQGIWVSSVKPGSPADRAGIRGGDIIRSLQGLVLSTDGTMTDYCDILRSHRPEDVLNVEVLRFATQEVLEGQINGRVLEPTFSFARELEEEVQRRAPDAAPDFYGDYVTVQDDSGTIIMDVPAEWRDVDGTAWTLDGETVGASISAAPDLAQFLGGWSVPGVFFGASRVIAQSFDEESMLNELDFSSDCDYQGRFDYSDPLYIGRYDVYGDCGGQGSTLVILSAVPETRAFIMLVVVQVVSQADLEALDAILNSFQVVGDL